MDDKKKCVSNKTPVQQLQERLIRNGIQPKYELVYDFTPRPSNVPKFTFKVSIEGITAHGSGITKKKAKQDAAKNMLIQISEDKDIPMLRSFAQTEDDGNFRNYIGNLSMFCARNKLGREYYKEYSELGPSHVPLFFCDCIVSKYRETGIAKSKKTAKHAAAKLMYEKLVNEVVEPNDSDLPSYRLKSEFSVCKDEKPDLWSLKSENACQEYEDMNTYSNDDTSTVSSEPDHTVPSDTYVDQTRDVNDTMEIRQREIINLEQQRSTSDSPSPAYSTDQIYNLGTSKNITISNVENVDRKFKIQLPLFQHNKVYNSTSTNTDNQQSNQPTLQSYREIATMSECNEHSAVVQPNDQRREVIPNSGDWIKREIKYSETIAQTSAANEDSSARETSIEIKCPCRDEKAAPIQSTPPSVPIDSSEALTATIDLISCKSEPHDSSKNYGTYSVNNNNIEISFTVQSSASTPSSESSEAIGNVSQATARNGSIKSEIEDVVTTNSLQIVKKDFQYEADKELALLQSDTSSANPSVFVNASSLPNEETSNELELNESLSSASRFSAEARAADPSFKTENMEIDEDSMDFEEEFTLVMSPDDPNLFEKSEKLNSDIRQCSGSTKVSSLAVLADTKLSSEDLHKPDSEFCIVNKSVGLSPKPQTVSLPENKFVNTDEGSLLAISTSTVSKSMKCISEPLEAVNVSHIKIETEVPVIEVKNETMGLEYPQYQETIGTEMSMMNDSAAADLPVPPKLTEVLPLKAEGSVCPTVSAIENSITNVSQDSASKFTASHSLLSPGDRQSDEIREEPVEVNSASDSCQKQLLPKLNVEAEKFGNTTDSLLHHSEKTSESDVSREHSSPEIKEKYIEESQIYNNSSAKSTTPVNCRQMQPKIKGINVKDRKLNDEVRHPGERSKPNLNCRKAVSHPQQRSITEVTKTSDIKVSKYHHLMLVEYDIDLRQKVLEKICDLVDAMLKWDLEKNHGIIDEGILILQNILAFIDLQLSIDTYQARDKQYIVVIHVNSTSDIVEMLKGSDLNEITRSAFFKVIDKLKNMLL